jgi:signal transduction histidine kinase
MVTVEIVAAGSATVLGVVLVGLAVCTHRRWEDPGRLSLAAFVGVLGLSGILTGVVEQTAGVGATTLWLATCAQVGALAWVAFALRYTGRARLVSTRVSRLAAVAYAGFLALPYALGTVGVVPNVLGFVAISGYMLGLVATLLGAALVLETTYRHGYLSGWVGAALTFVAVDPWFLTMVGFATQEQFPAPLLYALYAGGFFSYVVVLSLILFRSNAPSVTVATQTLGRRALLSETTDFVVVVDDDGRVVEQNDAVQQQLSTEVADGQPVSALLGAGVDDLRSADSLELSTVDGRRQYDVQAVALTGRGDTSLGWLISLRDITDRRRREQALDVLNRLLRHNLRNELDVTKARVGHAAETLDDPEVTDHLSTALSSVDSVLELAEKARATQQALDTDDDAPVTVPVVERVHTIAADVSEEVAGQVTVDGTETRIRTEEALFALAVRNVIENALEHSTAGQPRAVVTVTETRDGVRVRVDDNGPGIPSAETEAIRAGRETDVVHATSIGLWLVEWATTGAGGTVEFGNGPEGSRVDLWFPDV